MALIIGLFFTFKESNIAVFKPSDFIVATFTPVACVGAILQRNIFSAWNLCGRMGEQHRVVR